MYISQIFAKKAFKKERVPKHITIATNFKFKNIIVVALPTNITIQLQWNNQSNTPLLVKNLCQG